MPTREELIQGLPTPSQISADAQCAICYEPFTDPVQLPCQYGHIFCRECVASWLRSPEHNTCPLDRQKVFEINPHEEENSNEEPVALDWRRTEYSNMVQGITGTIGIANEAPEGALKDDVNAAMVPLRDSLLNADSFIGSDAAEYVANVKNVWTRIREVLAVIRSSGTVDDLPAVYRSVQSLLTRQNQIVHQAITVAEAAV